MIFEQNFERDNGQTIGGSREACRSPLPIQMPSLDFSLAARPKLTSTTFSAWCEKLPSKYIERQVSPKQRLQRNVQQVPAMR